MNIFLTTLNWPIDKYNSKEAKELLKKSGFRLNDSGYFSKNGKVFEIDWKVSSNRAALEIVETIKNYYEKSGVKVKIIVQEWGTFMRNFKNGQFDLVLGQWIGFTGPDMLRNIFHSDAFPPKGLNRGKYHHKKVDNQLDKATWEIDENKRNEAYRLAHRMANRDYAYINLWHPHIIWASQSCIKNINVYPNGSFHSLLDIESKCGHEGH